MPPVGVPEGYMVEICDCPDGGHVGARKAGAPECCHRCGFLTPAQFAALRGVILEDARRGETRCRYCRLAVEHDGEQWSLSVYEFPGGGPIGDLPMYCKRSPWGGHAPLIFENRDTALDWAEDMFLAARAARQMRNGSGGFADAVARWIECSTVPTDEHERTDSCPEEHALEVSAAWLAEAGLT